MVLGQWSIRPALLTRWLAALALVSPLVAVMALTAPPSAQAVKATGGEGRFVDSIEWITWGTNRQQIPRSGITRTETFRVGGEPVAVTCTVGPITGDAGNDFPLEAYRSGNWSGDALDQLYNVGGPDGNNTLVNGLSNRVGGRALTFDFSCSATLNGAPFPLAGLVMADAEQSGGGVDGEYVEATIPAGAEWRIVDRYRTPNCTASSIARRTGQTLRLAGPAGSLCPSGPSVVAFMDGATSATAVTVRGGGKSAIALGVAIDLDYSDAPGSYGTAGHAQQRPYTGGVVPEGTTSTVSNDSFALAEPGLPSRRLGPSIDADARPLTSADALGDDQDGIPAFGGPDDEDSMTFPTPRLEVFPGSTHTQQAECVGSQSVAGWIDWNDDGAFGSGERSDAAACDAGSATLLWNVPSTIPTGDVATFARVRSSSVAAAITAPTGVAQDGEVEDYAVTLRAPSIGLEKTAALRDLDGNGPDVGDAIDYDFTVTNTGTVPLNPVVVADPLLGGQIACGTGPLAGGVSRECDTQTYAVTQDDVESGRVVNTATATGTPSEGDDVTAEDSATVQLPSRPAISIDKSAGAIEDLDGNGPDTGDRITYSFTVQNTGNRPLTAVSISDPKVGPVSCTPTNLAPGGSATCQDVSYTLTQDDLQAGGVVNTATVTATTPGGRTITNEDSTTTSVPRRPALRLDKEVANTEDSNTSGRRDAGDRIDYTFQVSNIGNVTVTAVAVADPKIGSDVECPTGPVPPGQTVECTASYEITQADVDNGRVDNAATASALGPDQAVVRSNRDTTSTPTDSVPDLAVEKSVATTDDVNGNGALDAGDTITYGFAVENQGSVTITGLAISDPKTSGANCPTTTLAPGATTTCSKTYQVTQADVDSGSVANTATATGEDPDGDPVTSPPSTTDTPTADSAELTIDKRVAAINDENGNFSVDAGDTIDYEFTVTNTGSVTIGSIAVDDPKVGTVDCPVAVLAPGRSTTCAASYEIAQEDVNAGSVDNTATAAGTSPGGDAVASDPDSTTTTTATDASLSLLKSAGAPADVNGNGMVDAGDTVSYEFRVENTGSLTVDDVAVADPKIGTVACGDTSLDPADVVTCTAIYEITQADVDRGAVDNIASASGTAGGDPIQSNQSSTSTPTDFVAELGLVKRVDATNDVDDDDRLEVGDTIDYEFVVTNEGTVTTTFVGVQDAKTGGADCARTTLRPGQSVTCVQTYQVTQADVDGGSVDNTANATAQDPKGGPVESDPSATSTDTDSVARLRIDKEAVDIADVDGDGRLEAGDTIDYSFVVRNVGTLTITDIVVVDELVDNIACAQSSLAPGKQMTCTVTYEITQDDVDAGSVHNIAHAEGTTPSDEPVSSPEDSTSTTLDAEATLRFDKIAGAVQDTDADGENSIGDRIGYEFLVENTGTVTVTDLQILDPKIDTIDCSGTTELGPGESVTCTATYAVAQVDLDDGAVRNTARAAGRTAGGAPVESPEDSTTTPVPAESSMALVKTAHLLDEDGDERADAGERIRYRFEVTNTGATTVTDVEVHDGMLDRAEVEIDCPRTVLAPGDAMTCTAVYTVTERDLGGELENTATASGIGPNGSIQGSRPDTVATVTEEVSAAPEDDGDGGLPSTGGPGAWLLGAGVILVASGAVALALSRRRRTTTST